MSGDLVQCNACGGTYRTHIAPGARYFHACPDARAEAVADAGDGKAGVRTVPIPNRRNENTLPDWEPANKAEAEAGPPMISEGAGVTVLEAGE